MIVNWEAIAIVVGAVINSATFAYFYGRLSQRVDDHDRRIERIEAREDGRRVSARAAAGA